MYIADCNMTLGEKVRYLRLAEGGLRGLGREMTQLELVGALKEETGKAISQSYLSQIESGSRPHLTNDTRTLLARFFKVHPGYLVSDPPGYHEELTSELREKEQGLDVWLMRGAEHFRGDKALEHALLKLAGQPDSRQWLLLLGEILASPRLAERFREALTDSRNGRRRKERRRAR
jgi:transcriptional regulator with XRE-family HTH domain